MSLATCLSPLSFVYVWYILELNFKVAQCNVRPGLFYDFIDTW